MACGCDLVWLVTNSTFMDKLFGIEKCADDTLLLDLDPDVFAEICV